VFYTLTLLAVVTALFAYAVIKLRRWRNRPKRLCLACGALSYPSRDKDWNYRCPRCLTHHAPVALDDPAAIAYLARRGETETVGTLP
jgi:NADH pyrophosphatase NudC (nudix superfamily)